MSKRIDIAEFRELGFIQEINRLILHPVGLAMYVNISDDGKESLGGVADYRDDPEGVIFDDDVDLNIKASSVEDFTFQQSEYREEKFGWVIQPLSDSE